MYSLTITVFGFQKQFCLHSRTVLGPSSTSLSAMSRQERRDSWIGGKGERVRGWEEEGGGAIGKEDEDEGGREGEIGRAHV